MPIPMDPKDFFSTDFLEGSISSHIGRQHNACPSVIVIGGGISGIAAARVLHDASFKVILLESRDRLGGRIHTDYSFGCPVDMGASWLHGVCNENPLAPLIRRLGLTLYRTSGDDSVLYDHDLESYALFDMDGRQVPQEMVIEVGDTFKQILKETEKVRNENTDDMSVSQAISIVMDRHPELRQNGLAHEVLQWYICRMEAWFAADADVISLKNWDQVQYLNFSNYSWWAGLLTIDSMGKSAVLVNTLGKSSLMVNELYLMNNQSYSACIWNSMITPHLAVRLLKI